MAYCKINKTGCMERKGHPQIRFDMFLEPGDPRYEDTYIQVPVIPANMTASLCHKGNKGLRWQTLWRINIKSVWGRSIKSEWCLDGL